MGIRNEMEQLVRDEAARVRRQDGPAASACRCLLCETDVVALALTLLPPLYCRTESFGTAVELVRAGKIHDAVQAALKRVMLRPKHRSGVPGPARELSLVNYAWEVGSELVGVALGRAAAGCSCGECRADTLAYALNRYPAKYGVRQGGRQSLHPTYLEFMRRELGLLIGQAASVVSSRPHRIPA